jgi:hypothetical protein
MIPVDETLRWLLYINCAEPLMTSILKKMRQPGSFSDYNV